jgi:hypothetical protein
MEQEQALALVAELLARHGLDGSEPETGEDVQLDGDESPNTAELFADGDPEVAFHYDPQSGVLEGWALIYEFSEAPKPGILEACHEEAASGGTDMGGGELKYEPRGRALYLRRGYSEPLTVEQLAEDMERLHQASVVWGEEVLPRVGERVFHPEEAAPHA